VSPEKRRREKVIGEEKLSKEAESCGKLEEGNLETCRKVKSMPEGITTIGTKKNR